MVWQCLYMNSLSDSAHFTLRGGDAWISPWDDYRTLRDDSPAHRVTRSDGTPYWVLSRFEDVFQAARDTETFSSAKGLTPDEDAMAMFDGVAAPIVMMDPPDHTAMRRLVSRPMTPRRVQTIEPAVTEFVDAALDRIASVAGEVDIIAELFKPLPSFVVAHYLGVPVQDRIRFDGWTNAIVAANADGDVSSAGAAAFELFEYASELIERRKTEPGDDLVSLLVEAGEDRASAMWIVGFIFTMVTGGNDTVTGLLGGAAALLSEHPDQRQALVDEPRKIADSIDEFLRLTSPVQNLARTTTRPVELHRTKIPANHKVLLLYGAANRDEREFGPDADVLNIERQPGRVLSLGYGPHHCLGAAAARLQGRVALERLLDRFPDFVVNAERAQFASGGFVRRYENLPFQRARS